MFEYQAPPDLLKGLVIIVTGAGSGIGKTASLTFAQHGATVILMGRTITKLESVYDEIEKNQWPKPAIYPIDLAGADENDYKTMAETIGQTFHCIDGLLHNAAQIGELKPISQYHYDTWKNVLQVNLNSAFLLTRELLPLLRKSSEASIVFTSSSVGHKGRAHWGAYSVSKFATEGLMQTLADEEDGIGPVRCNSINPGGTRTQMRASAFPAEDPLTRPTPEQIMPLYLYLMGADSKGVNGKAWHAQA
ncbi:MAG: YciK family oxidoreductase [Endozoicomonas sp. (ex Botrylloides leachii)]|nr:YciK family oxidoreductase [Endozoicomonas sp. (ex Botrylloides leachii)]